MIKGLATMYELASVKQSDLTGSQTFSNALREGFFLFLWNYYFFVFVCPAECPLCSMCLISVIMS